MRSRMGKEEEEEEEKGFHFSNYRPTAFLAIYLDFCLSQSILLIWQDNYRYARNLTYNT